MDATSKRERPDSADGNVGDSKRIKETDSFQPVIRSKGIPCTRFFSTAGCRYGEDCHYLHYFPGGLQAVHRMTGLSNPALVPPFMNPFAPPPFCNTAFGPARKSRICNKYDTVEGCKFGERCHFAHGQHELAQPPPSRVNLTVSYKISVDASIVGLFAGRGGFNIKNILRRTGAKLSIQPHESNRNLKMIKLEGNYDQIDLACRMVRDRIDNITARTTPLPVSIPAPAT